MKTKLFFFAFAQLLCVTLYSQNTITVDNNPGVVEVPNLIYANLQDAIDAAQNEDILYIQASVTTYGNATLNKQLSIIGRSHSENNYVSKLEILTLQPNASNSTFSGLYIANRVYLYNSQPVTNLVFKNNYVDDFYISRLTSNFTNALSNSIIVGNVIKGISSSCGGCSFFQDTIFTNNIFLTDDIRFQSTNITFNNNIIIMASNDNSFSFFNQAYNVNTNPTNINLENCIIIKPQGAGAVTSVIEGIQFNNCISYNEQSTFVVLPGSNNINDINPQLVNVANNTFDAYTDDYHLSTGSPAINAGTDGEDIGIYNASGYLFNMLGKTYGIPSVNITNITETVQEGETLQVTIQALSN